MIEDALLAFVQVSVQHLPHKSADKRQPGVSSIVRLRRFRITGITEKLLGLQGEVAGREG